MWARNLFVLIFFCIQFSLNAQYNFSSHNVHNSIIDAIRVNNHIIKSRTEDFEKKAEAKPLLFLREKKYVGQLNHVSNSVSDYIKELKSEANTERILYDLLEEDFFKNILFTFDDTLTPKGELLKTKLDSLYDINMKINIRGFSHLKDFANDHFKTDGDYYDEAGEELDYFHYLFHDKSNYGIMMALNVLLLDVKTNQLLFFGTVMSY